MMKKTTQTLLLVFSTLLLLVSVTGSTQGQPTPRPTPRPDQDRLRGSSPSFTGNWNTVTDKGKKFGIALRSERADSSLVTGSYGVSCLMGRYSCLTGSYKPSDGSINGFVKVSWSAEPVLQSKSSIKGTLTGNVLRFTWAEDGAQGAGRFTLSSDGESFEGTYSMTNNPDDPSGGTWNGTRAYSFAGAWRAKLGEQFLELILQPYGNQVTGELRGFSYPVVIREGIVDGNTLRFQVMRVENVSRPDLTTPMGTGELVMDKGGKSFTGTLLGAATSGTLIGR